MGRRIQRLDDQIESFIMSYWDTDLREDDDSAFAREDLRGRGLYDAVRRFLLDVIHRDAMTPEEWRDLCNVTVDSLDDFGLMPTNSGSGSSTESRWRAFAVPVGRSGRRGHESRRPRNEGLRRDAAFMRGTASVVSTRPGQQAALLPGHLVDKVPVSDICNAARLQPSLFYG